ncbi:MAG TPA: flavocytochrome c [Clostridiales bacterium]|nr:flavocytochrome c [Clostridiales bacterium]
MLSKLTSVLLCLAMLLTMCSFAMAEAGTYTGVGDSEIGGKGAIEVSVTVDENGVVTDIQVTKNGDTAGIADAAVETMPGRIMAAQSANVDGVSGATMTSEAIKMAVLDAVTAAGLDTVKWSTYVATEAAKADDATYNTDIVIIGAGGAGMTAALTAAEKGADVIILESQAAVGGNSVRATGGMNAADTPAQDENEFGESAGVEKTLKTARTTYADNVTITKLAEEVEKQWADYQANPVGYFDSDELMELDTMIGGKGINNPELVEELADESADGVEWLKNYGINLTSVGSFGGASVKRIHRPVNAEGKTIAVGSYMIPLLEKACEENDKISIQLETTATTILTDENGKAVGVKAVGATGNEVTVNAKAVILATGGFGANLDMVAELVPALKGFMTTNAAGAQGQGIEMAQALGAATVDMDQIQIHPTVQFDTAALITEGLRGDGAVLINAEGKRFIDEVGTRDVVSAAEIAQPGSYSYLVVDQAMLDKSSVIAGYVKRGFVFQGNTYEELAEALGVDAATFAETMNTWNTYVEAKNDPDFGRTSFAQPLNTAPYYAIKVTAGVHHTMGGLVINTDTEVLKADGTAIAGLYAAGEVTGGVHGANRLGGNAVADFVVFGRIAGEEAAEYALGE